MPSSSSFPKHVHHHQHFCKAVLGCYHGVRIMAVANSLVRSCITLTHISESNPFPDTPALLLRVSFLLLTTLDLWHTASTLLMVLDSLRAPTLPLGSGLADRTLLSAAFLGPWFNTAQAALSNWTVQTDSWPCLYAIAMFIPGSAAGFPPAFTVLLWCFLTPCVMLNDFWTHCQSLSRHPGACLADLEQSCSMASFTEYLCGQGMATLATGLAAGILQILLQILRERTSTPTSPRQQDTTTPPFFSMSGVLPALPKTPASSTHDSCHSDEPAAAQPHALAFQTLTHLPFLAALGRCAALAQLQQWLFSLMSHVELDADVVLGLVCLPLGLYYTALANLCRLGFSPRGALAVHSPVELTPNEVFVMMLSCVVVGRTSHHLQTSGLLQQVQDQLDRCVECLADVFPTHVAKRLLSMDGSYPQPEAPTAAAAPHCCAIEVEEPSSSSNSSRRSQAFEPRPLSQKPDFVGSDAPIQHRSSDDPELLRVRSLENGNTRRERSFWSNSTDLHASPASSSSPQVQVQPQRPQRASSPSSRSAAQRLPVVGSLTTSLRLRLTEEANLCRDVAQTHDSVTIFFSDIVSFSTWSHDLPPDKVMHTLNDLFTRLDNVIMHEMPTLYKIETIGDAYVVGANLLSHDPEHAATAVRFAIRAQEEAAKVLRPDRDDGSTIEMRIGLHSGSVMSGVVGRLRRRFCVFGDVVNMGARTEASCPPGGIQLTSSTHDLALPHLAAHVRLVERGEFQVKGADEPLKMYLVEQRLPAALPEEDWASLE